MATFDMSELMTKVARLWQGQYSLEGRLLTMDEVFSPTGLLPGIARRADQLASLCLGYGIGASFEEVEGTPLGIKVIFDDITPNVVRLLCMVDVLAELMRGIPPGGVTELDQLTYD